MRKVITLYSLSGLLMVWFMSANACIAAAQTGDDTLTFVHITDVHICNLTGYHQAFVQKRQQFGNGINTYPGFLKTVPEKVNADFVVVTGDNIDYYEAETEKGDI